MMPDYVPTPIGTVLACVLVITYLIVAKVQDSRENRRG